MRLTGSRVYSGPSPVPKMPTGLVELMEGLTKDALKNNPADVYEFCANHMKTLLEIRDGSSHRKVLSLEEKIKRAQEKVKRRAELHWKKYQMELLQVKAEIVDNSLKNLKKESSVDNSSIASNNIKLFKPVHHDRDLTNASEIEISYGSGGIDTASNENLSEVILNENIDEQPKSLVAQDLHSITKDKAPEKSNDDTLEVKLLTSNETSIDIITDPIVEIEQENVSLVKQMEMKNDEGDDLRDNASEDVKTSNTTDSADIKTLEETSLKSVEKMNTEDINAKNSYDANVNDTKEIVLNDFHIKKTVSVGDYNSNKTVTVGLDTSNDGIDQENSGENNSYIVKNDGNINKFDTETIRDLTDKDTSENESASVQPENVLIDITTKDNSNDLNINETKDDLNNSDGNNIKGNSPDEKNIYTDAKTKIDAKINILEEKASVPVSEKTLHSEIFSAHSDENTVKENLEVTSHNEPNMENQNIVLTEKTSNQTLVDTHKEDNIDERYPNDYNVLSEIEEDIKEININNSKNENSEVDLEQEVSTALVVASAESQMSIEQNSGLMIDNKDHSNEIEKNVTDEQLSHSVNNLQLESNNKTHSLHDETDDVFKDSSNILSQTDTVQSEIRLNKQNFADKTINRQDLDVDTNIKILEAHQDNEVRGSFDDSITEETNNAIEGVVMDYTDETIMNDSANTMDLETAAVTIQKVFRTFLFKSRTSTFDDSANDDNNFPYEDNDEDKMDKQSLGTATINKDRRTLGISRMDTVLQTVNEEKSLSLSTDDSSTLSSAATVIQAHVRGFLVRNKLNSGKPASSSDSLINSDGPLTTSFEREADQNKNKTILNIHIVPEGNNFLSRDESMITSMDLSLDGSPLSSVNLHPSYDKTNERRKQLKREDAIQSISPPSNNSGKLSDDVESVKEIPVNVGAETNATSPEHDTATATLLNNTSQDTEIASIETTPSNSVTIETVVEEHTSNTEMLSSPEPLDTSDIKKRSLTKQSSDEMDVVTPFKENITQKDVETPPKLLHSGEFHDTVLPTKVSRSNTPVVSEFKNVLVYFLLWNN